MYAVHVGFRSLVACLKLNYRPMRERFGKAGLVLPPYVENLASSATRGGPLGKITSYAQMPTDRVYLERQMDTLSSQLPLSTKAA